MGNRAVITASKDKDVANSNDIGVYLHWNGGRNSVEAFLAYCKMKGYRTPEVDNYGWARLCQVIGNFFGGECSVGVDRCCKLDCDNGDNGTYVIRNWEIVDHKYPKSMAYDGDVRGMLYLINNSMPICEQVSSDRINRICDERGW